MCLDDGMNTATTTDLPELTPEVVEQLRAFGIGDIFAVRIVRDVKSRCGNTLIGKGCETWAMESRQFAGCGTGDSLTVWTGHTHYAGCKSSSIKPNRVKRLAVAS
jgi:hypothetical protein